MKKYLKTISITFIVLIVIYSININTVNAMPNYKRIFGANRYETSKEISKNGWEKADYAIIASGEGFADVLSAAPMAKKYDAPIILTECKGLNENAKEELERLKVKEVIIVGGIGAISSNTENEIKNLDIKTRRIAGNSRFDTSLQVAKEIGSENGIVVVNGYNFGDALSISSIAANKGMPILLTKPENLSNDIKTFINNSGYSKSYIVGGNSVVGKNVEYNLKNCKRICGNNRYATNVAILNEFVDEINLESVYVVSGSNYPDALSVSSLAAKINAPLMLASSQVDVSMLDFMNKNVDNIKNVNVIGGKSVVNSDMVNIILNGKIDISNNNNYYVKYEKYSDVNGDGKDEKVQLVCSKEYDEYFVKEIYILIKDANTDMVLEEIKAKGCHTSPLRLYDFNKDGSMDIFVQMPCGGSGGYVQVEIYSFKDNKLKVLYDDENNNNNGIMHPNEYISVNHFTGEKEIEFRNIDCNKVFKVDYLDYLKNNTYIDDSKGYFDWLFVMPVDIDKNGENDIKTTSWYIFDYKKYVCKVETIYTWDVDSKKFVIKDINFLPGENIKAIYSE
ncbi:cell wall-binding repeat-containing protein [Clostridium sp. ATCC 25772]|uniref:cell wall-binding repeat-containing protein n=1 Tax=Clostridium sp. ATCC 25772 TaxID=1676991 RepID=UPI0007824C80|nr:cell wall-binding repeat-containing protein [Clostridium sp. ATCC 25772]